MPYINTSSRAFIEPSINDLVDTMKEIDGGDVVSAGLANYVISSTIVRTLRPPSGWTYGSLSKALAVFRDAEAEMRRRLLDPYEDKAIAKNGDIPEYEQ
jgi:hypothetical protein